MSPAPDLTLSSPPDPDSLSPDQLRAALREANQRLAERERHLELIEHLAGIGSWEIDLDRDSVRWSRELKRMHGFDDQTAPARHSIFMEQVLHPGDVQLVNEKMSALSAEEPVTVEFRARRTDGEIRLFQARGLLVRGEDGALSRVIGTSLDITDRRKMVLALRASEESYRTIFEHASDAMWVHDLDTGNFLAVNQAAVHMYGFSVEEQLARGVAGMSAGFAPFRIEDALPFISGAAQGVPQRFEWLGRHKDGHLIWGEVRLRRVTLNGVERILATARDINDRVKAEVALRQANEALEERVKERTAQLELAVAEEASARAALAESEEHFRRIIEGAADLVFICDHQGAMTYVGPSSMAMLGFTPAELMGATPDVLLHPDDLSATMDDLQWLAEHPGEPVTSTFRMRRKDGTYLVMENLGRTLSPHSIADGVIAFGRDITGRRAAEEALARAKEEAERANRAKSEFLSRMSHELRTPMNSILGFAQLLARTDLPMQQGKSVQHILKAGKHLLHLINEVLEIARIEAGREQFSLEPVALAPVLEEALGLVRPLAQQNGVALHGGPWAADTFVHADRQRLVQVLLNLLSNAIKYNHHGGSVHLRSEITPEGRSRVQVTDTGRGVAPDRLDELFTPFARLGAEQSDVEGTGLGLALSRRLCEAMEGSLSLESSTPFGSVFAVSLATAESPLRVFESGTHIAAVTTGHPPATLLYIEDNLANLSLVETILLARPGWRVLPALQAQLGIELAREHRPDVILLDLHLPDLPGVDVLRRLRADPRTAEVPVVIVSADATASSVERLRVMGADAYLTKPLDVDEFLRVVDRFVPRTHAPA